MRIKGLADHHVNGVGSTAGGVAVAMDGLRIGDAIIRSCGDCCGNNWIGDAGFVFSVLPTVPQFDCAGAMTDDTVPGPFGKGLFRIPLYFSVTQYQGLSEYGYSGVRPFASGKGFLGLLGLIPAGTSAPVCNDGAVPLSLYPPPGAGFQGLARNAATTVAAGTCAAPRRLSQTLRHQEGPPPHLSRTARCGGVSYWLTATFFGALPT